MSLYTSWGSKYSTRNEDTSCQRAVLKSWGWGVWRQVKLDEGEAYAPVTLEVENGCSIPNS